VAARLENTQALSGERHARGQAVPLAAHEPEAVGRVGDDGVHRVVGQAGEDVEAVTVIKGDRVI
jgi:hypothetical protein